MVRTQVQLTAEQVRALRQMAAREGVSVAELIRRSVDAWLRRSNEVPLEERLRRAIAVAGRFRSGLPDLAVHHDKYLAEALEE